MLLKLNGGSNTIECVGIRYAAEIALTIGILTFITICIAVDRYRLIVYQTFLRTIFVIIGLLIVSFNYIMNFFVESTFNEICNISTERGFWLMVASVLFYCAFCCTLSCSDSFLKIVKNRWRKDEVLSASTLVKGRTVTVALVCSLSYVMFWSPFYIIENAPDNYAWSDWLDKLVVNRRLVTIFIAVYKSYHLWML